MNKKLLPLALLDVSEGDSIEGITRFQKIVFLMQKENRTGEIYKFVPGSYGPFSKSLYDDIDRLVKNGFIENNTEPTILSSSDDKQIYKLNEKGKRALQQGLREGQLDFSLEELQGPVEEYNQMNLWNLLEYVYSEYPGMAENSKLHI